MIESLVGTPWQEMSCIGLVNALDSVPSIDGTKWGRVNGLVEVPWRKRRDGDIVLWRKYDTMWVPKHAGVIVNAAEHYVMHSGYTGRPHPGWERDALVCVFQLQRLSDRGTVLRGRPL